MKQIGRYQLQEKLGQGGMGVVYRAFDTLLERIVAVKVISASIDDNPELRDRFFREARAAGQLSHPNIITVHDLGEHEGQPYLAMEFLEGEDLQSRMARREPMSLRRKLEIACDICAGLEYAHGRSIVHRDIKPANIFLSKGGGVKILDFGLARLVSSELTRSHVMMGTLNYMAPEQIRGERADHRADLFSVGVVLYELIGGRKAFEGDSFASMMFKILEQPPTPLLELDPTLPPEVVNIVDRALAKLRDERYQTIAELERDLTMVRHQLAFLESPASGRVIPSAVRSAPPTPLPTPAPAAAASFDETRLSTPVPPPAMPSPGSSPSAGLTPAPGAPGSEAPTVLVPGGPGPQSRRTSPMLLGLVALIALAVTTGMWFLTNRRPAAEPPPASAVAPAPSTDELLAQALAAFDAEDFAAAEQGAAAVLAIAPGHAAAAALRDRAQAAHTAVATGLERARALAADGRYEEASKAAGDVLAVAPRNVDAKRIVEDAVTQSRGRSATDARGQAARARGAARGASAPTLAARPWAAAVAAEREAQRLLDGGDAQAATIKFYEATGLFAGAQTAAEQEAAARRTRARADASPAQTTAPGPPPPAPEHARATPPATSPATAAPAQTPAQTPPSRPEEPVRTPPVQEQPETPPPTAPPPAPAAQTPAPPRAPAPQPTVTPASPPADPGAAAAAATTPAPPPPSTAVSRVIDAYEAALEGRSLAAMQRIWPGLRGAELTGLRDEFEHARQIDVEIESPRISVDGNNATATFMRHYSLLTTDGQRLVNDNFTTMTLTRRDGAWIIESLRFAPR